MSELEIKACPGITRSEASTSPEVVAFHVDRETQIRASLWGNGNPVFLLLHGFGDGWFVWEDIALALAEHGTVMALDLRGHGRSDWDTSGSYSRRKNLTDVTTILETLTGAEIYLVGHSMGGELAIHLALETGEYVSGVALLDYSPTVSINTSTYIREHVKGLGGGFKTVELLAHQIRAAYPFADEGRITRLASHAVKKDGAGHYVMRRDPRCGSMIELSETQYSTVSKNAWATLQKLECPLTILVGEYSSVVTAETAKRMAGAAPCAELRVIPKAGHNLMIDNHDACVSALLDLAGIMHA